MRIVDVAGLSNGKGLGSERDETQKATSAEAIRLFSTGRVFRDDLHAGSGASIWGDRQW